MSNFMSLAAVLRGQGYTLAAGKTNDAARRLSWHVYETNSCG
jgi:hypothetical protein